ncbi:MAG: DUF1295 domain-containing protein [Alphaproteobacteria bacterium]|nr:DUF1295 domain-containing protein [Alphaproteobacteria bacterium]MDP6568007.1 DUF1295 domain-containing protein [Alphaproteobacteria bacterium]MDP6814386.1 DUF1295 domain-containing protein [Alphaproteobacteria bacterium]
MAVALAASLMASVDVLFGERLGVAFGQHPYRTDGDLVRGGILLVCLAIYVMRVFATLFVFYRRVMYWREALLIANLMPWFLVCIAYYGGRQTGPIGLLEAIGLAIYLLGSYLNSAGEYARHKWKLAPANAGRLYTSGLFTAIRHVNYTGDILLFSGLALVAHQFGLLVIPLGMAFFFLFVLIPLKERYLSGKYGREFEAYAARTKMLIPKVL